MTLNLMHVYNSSAPKQLYGWSRYSITILHCLSIINAMESTFTIGLNCAKKNESKKSQRVFFFEANRQLLKKENIHKTIIIHAILFFCIVN